MQAVAGALDDVSAACFDGVPQELVVVREYALHLGGLLLPERGRAFDVREQERQELRRDCHGPPRSERGESISVAAHP